MTTGRQIDRDAVHDYLRLCEDLWRGWLAGSLPLSESVLKTFDLNAAPEPYLDFGASPGALVALTTNPGGTMWHQQRAAVAANAGPLSVSMPYAEAARVLADFYRRELKGPARSRIAALERLARDSGMGGLLQVEAIPFHSPALPRKAQTLERLKADAWLMSYTAVLEECLRDRAVVIVDAVSTRTTLAPDAQLNAWTAWKARLAGLDPSRAAFVPLVSKGPKVTCAALVNRGQAPKALVLMMGGNHLPSELGLGALAAQLRRSVR